MKVYTIKSRGKNEQGELIGTCNGRQVIYRPNEKYCNAWIWADTLEVVNGIYEYI